MSSVELESLESLLTTNLSGNDLAEARRLLFGRDLKALEISEETRAKAELETKAMFQNFSSGQTVTKSSWLKIWL